MSGHTATRFKITWTDSRYFVSIPNYSGGEVVDAAVYDALSNSHADLVRALEAARPAIDNLTNHQEQCDMDGCFVKVSRQALDETLAAIALATLTARKVG